jgi:CRP-like cAMP-binding protein
VIATPARAAFLTRIHLFRDLKEAEVLSIAEKMQEETFESGQEIFKQGSVADRFFIIHQGKVKITQTRRKKNYYLATLIVSDYFGEEALFSNHRRSASVTATEKTVLFSLTRDEFNKFIKKYSKLKPSFEVSLSSRRIARQQRFNWLADGEVIYFVARKHEILLVRSLTSPVFTLIFPVGLTIWFLLSRALSALAVAIILYAVISGWIIWNWIDWGNDYYIVTNQRVIWLEKVIGLYDSRQESPLSSILSVGVETDPTGRLLDYGDVIVRTFTGKILFSHVSHPYQAAHMVEELWGRSKQGATRAEKEAVRNMLRKKLGLPVSESKPANVPAEPKMNPPSLYKPSLIKAVASNWFKLRTEEGGTITYRKHWYVLWQQVWQPTLLFLLMVGGVIARIITIIKSPDLTFFTSNGAHVDSILLMLVLFMLPLSIWWGWQYVDWSNDIYQVTSDQILDLDRKPFGKEQRSAAPLENILGTEYKRIGIPGVLLNFGTVVITVGGTKFEFKDVMDPPGVQADIDRRRATRMAKKKEAEGAADRDRFTDWLAVYHENVKDFYEEQNRPKPETKSE